MNVTSDLNIIPFTQGFILGQTIPMVDARLLHRFLGVHWDFSTWIKRRIKHYAFEENLDYITRTQQWRHLDSTKLWNQDEHGGDRRSRDYFLTIDMAKELAMVERTARGREVRRYFIDCERQLRQLQQAGTSARPTVVVELSRAQRQAINRQAWADVAGQACAHFHARREELLQVRAEKTEPVLLPKGFRPDWAK